jgi:hypothetical protein
MGSQVASRIRFHHAAWVYALSFRTQFIPEAASASDTGPQLEVEPVGDRAYITGFTFVACLIGNWQMLANASGTE